jgi:RNA polymerase sigma-70 factor (ECF subfamily)
MTRREYGNAYASGLKGTRHLLLRHGANRDLACDLAQAAWEKGWERLGDLRNSEMVVSWVNSIAINLLRTLWRREVNNVPLEAEHDVMIVPGVNNAALEVHYLLRSCRPSHQIVLKEYYLQGLGVAEIARSHGRDVGAIHSALSRARRAVRRHLTERSIGAVRMRPARSSMAKAPD